jgi:hypothetical protein
MTGAAVEVGGGLKRDSDEKVDTNWLSCKRKGVGWAYSGGLAVPGGMNLSLAVTWPEEMNEYWKRGGEE